jgi:L-asparaginase II
MEQGGAIVDQQQMQSSVEGQALVVAKRGALTENVHKGRICVVSADSGEVVASCGDADAPAYIRSTAKPMQAIASVRDGMPEACGWSDRHLALMAASQRGYPAQMVVLQEMLDTSGVPESALVFQPAVPLADDPRDAWARGGGRSSKLYHTCAGKHLGVLAWCRKAGWPLDGYWSPEHPAQQAILREVLAWCDADSNVCQIGRDGCGLPVVAMPLSRIAFGYARLACPDAVAGKWPSSEQSAAAIRRIVQAMHRHPDLVEGPDRLASLLLRDANIVAKSGAQGLFAIGLRRQRLGIAIHLSAGTEAAWPHIVLQLLREWGALSAELETVIHSRFPAEIVNDTGMVSGRWETVFRLRRG